MHLGFEMSHAQIMIAYLVIELHQPADFLQGTVFPGGGGGGNSHIKRMGVSSYLLGVKKALFVPLWVFSLKRSTAGALVVHILGY